MCKSNNRQAEHDSVHGFSISYDVAAGRANHHKTYWQIYVLSERRGSHTSVSAVYDDRYVREITLSSLPRIQLYLGIMYRQFAICLFVIVSIIRELYIQK